MGFFKFTRRSKYNNKKVEYDGMLFDSKKEKERYVFLKKAEDDGLIYNLETQVKFVLIPAIREEYEEQLKTKTRMRTRTVQKAITYTCDFRYIHNGEPIIEDVKSSPVQASLDKCFCLKEKIFRWKYGFSIKRVYKSNQEI